MDKNAILQPLEGIIDALKDHPEQADAMAQLAQMWLQIEEAASLVEYPEIKADITTLSKAQIEISKAGVNFNNISHAVSSMTDLIRIVEGITGKVIPV